MFAVGLVLIGVGFAVGLILTAMLLASLALGIISLSTIVAVARNSFWTGIRTFSHQICSLVFAGAGVLMTFLISTVFDLSYNGLTILAVGLLSGSISGLSFSIATSRAIALVGRKLECIRNT